MKVSNSAPVIYWFRQDLRLSDLPALQAAASQGRPIIPCYLLDDDTPGEWAVGGAARWWLHHSLLLLNQSLEGKLLVRRGDTLEHLLSLQEETGAVGIYCSALHEPWNRHLEQSLATALAERHVDFHRGEGYLLCQPGQVATKTGDSYKVFTPFWRACLDWLQPGPCLPPVPASAFAHHFLPGLIPEEYGLLPPGQHWWAHWLTLWTPGEAGARERLYEFVDNQLQNYANGRDLPGQTLTSRLSPHLHWGELSPRQVWHTVVGRSPDSADRERFLAELGWREFNHHLLSETATMPETPFKSGWGQFPWRGDRAQFKAWCRGQTGYPMVDAGMRELWHTGTMHNRVRMICASFLCKHLLLHWRWGQRWFWDTLVDANLANNSCNWQWVAGCGADAAPYFRIFNPVVQGQKFDAGGAYVRRWVPELAALPDRYLHAPWETPRDILTARGVTIGMHYPEPIVCHAEARERALAAYRAMSEPTSEAG